MASISKLTFFDREVLYREVIGSTNDFIKEHLTDNQSPKSLAIYTDYQTLGRGQRQKQWDSTPKENLLFSLLFSPAFFPIEKAHLISQEIALSIVKILNNELKQRQIFIKWPNDIIANDKKIGGILVETQIKGDNIQHFIIGIGLNIFQKKFADEMPNASSLSLTFPTIDWDRLKLLSLILNEIEIRLKKLEDIEFKNTRERYNSNLYRINQIVRLKKNESIDEYINQGVDENGNWLLMRVTDNQPIKIISSGEYEYIF